MTCSTTTRRAGCGRAAYSPALMCGGRQRSMRKALVGVLFLLLMAPPADGKATKPRLTSLERSSRSVLTVMAGDREGAAFAYGKPGRLVTNAHVVGSSRRVELITVAGRHGDGRVVT